jgi:S-adenosylmethionine decarboxylase
MLVYERKNEHFPHAQRTSFFDDARRLRKMIDGRAVRFGVEHEHAIRMFHTTREHQPEPDDRTLEVLMHGIDERFAETFRASRRPTGSPAAELGLSRVLEGFELDEFVFEPTGYSFNGIKGAAYATLHVTPERLGSYVSFETNDPSFGRDPTAWVRELVECFRPESFDVVAFEPDARRVHVEVPGYVLRKHVREPVSGYHVTFQHFYRRSPEPVRAFEIPLR